MWTAEITQVNRDSDNPMCKVRVAIKFDDGTDRKHTLLESFSNTSMESLKKYARDRITQLEATDAFIAAPTIGLLDLTVSKPTSIEPTIEEQIKIDAERNFLADLQIYRQMQSAADLGLIAHDDKALVDQIEKLKVGWDLDYLKYMGGMR